MRCALRSLLLAASILTAAGSVGAWAQVGVARIAFDVAGVEAGVRVFYPTDARAAMTAFGPWELALARNAPIRAGRHPLIAVSHGLGGTDWNHHLLASRLVGAGFVVAAVRHPDDLLRFGRPGQMRLRTRELAAAIDAVLDHPRFASAVDRNRIGAFGYSLGGLTALLAAGGRADRGRLRAHCSQPARDPEYCVGEEGGASLPIWLRLRRLFHSMPEAGDQLRVDRRIRSLAIAAPVGQPLTDLDRVRIPVLLIRAGADAVLRHPFHAERIHALLPEDHTYRVAEGAHHHAFLSPFPERIADEVGRPAQDPDGFDRLGFLDTTNEGIAAFFVSNLMRSPAQ